MTTKNTENNLISPPVDVPEIQRGDWYLLPPDDPICAYIDETLWDRSDSPQAWQVARLSQAVYLYRETNSRWKVAAKFYTQKKEDVAQEYALREAEIITRIRETGLTTPGGRAIKPLPVWKGVLFLEHVQGLTLEDIIAVRRSRPGLLGSSLNQTATFLASLHEKMKCPESERDFESRLDYIRKILKTLREHGVLQENPVVIAGLNELIEHWSQKALMREYTPVWIHGDATTSNFIFSEDKQLVVIDWERAKLADPASDLGRLMAEVSHSITQHGGSVTGAQSFVQQVATSYCRALTQQWNCQALMERARFYRALSTLRIARNGWVSRLDRMGLVAQALALLTEERSNVKLAE